MVTADPNGYLKCVEAVERDAYEILTGKHYAVSAQFAQELYHILSRLEQLRLDNDLLSTSKDARKSMNHNPNDLNKRYGEEKKCQKLSQYFYFFSSKSPSLLTQPINNLI